MHVCMDVYVHTVCSQFHAVNFFFFSQHDVDARLIRERPELSTDQRAAVAAALWIATNPLSNEMPPSERKLFEVTDVDDSHNDPRPCETDS